MKPTNKLRFVERSVEMHPFYKTTNEKGELVTATQTYRVLQQWWETTPMGTMNLGFGGEIPLGEVTGEWRDIPIEEENT